MFIQEGCFRPNSIIMSPYRFSSLYNSMLKRLLPFSLLLLLLLLTPPTALAQKTFFWDAFDVDIRLRADGTLDVTEHQTLVFDGGDFSFGFATIPYQRLDNIRNVTVREGDRVYDRSSTNAPYTFELTDNGSELEIYWYFPPTQGSRTYTFSYTVEGAVRVEESGSQLFWMAIPDDMSGRVNSSRVTIQLPPGVSAESTLAQLDGIEGGATVTVDQDGRRATFDMLNRLFPGEAFEVGVRFPVEQLSLPTPQWQRQEQLNDVWGLTILVISLAAVVIGPIGVLALWYTQGRDPDVGVMPEYITKRPSDLPPALVGSLVDEHAELRDIVSTLVDLARRGYLTIQEQKSDHVYQLTNQSKQGLRAYERSLLQSFFGRNQSRKLSTLRYKFANKLPQLQTEMYAEMVNEGLFNRSPETVRGLYRGIGFFGLISGVVLLFVLGDMLAAISTSLCLGLAVIPGALTMLYTATHMPRKTEKGAEEAAKWNAFKEYLKNIQKYSNEAETGVIAGEVFSENLAYAIVFGLERHFIRQFSQRKNVPMPTWYHPYSPQRGRYRGAYGIPGGRGGDGGTISVPSLDDMSGGMMGGLDSMSQGLTRMLNSTSTILQSQKTETDGGGGFGGGGGGFSGGFGGGSSGGGSRGFG